MAAWIFQNSPLLLASIGIVFTLSGAIYYLLFLRIKAELSEIVKKEVAILKEPFYKKGEIHRMFISNEKLEDTLRMVEFRLKSIEKTLKEH